MTSVKSVNINILVGVWKNVGKFKNKVKWENVKPDDQLDYSQIVFNQLQRIAQQQTSPHLYGGASNGINTLEDLTVPHHDEEYLEELKDINKWFNKKMGDAQVLGRVDGGISEQISFQRNRKKFRALMKMLDRKNLLPEEHGDLVEE